LARLFPEECQANLALVSPQARAVKEAKNFDVSLLISYFVNDQIVAMNQPSNVGSALKDLSAVREVSEFLSFVDQSRRKSLGRFGVLFAGRYEEHDIF
jgi:hypothetical protein